MGVPHYFRRIIFSLVLISTFLWLYNSRGISLQPKYNSFSCPGYVTPTIRSNGFANRNITTKTSSTAASSSVTPSSSEERILPDFTQSPFAYVFYATQPDYACAVLVNIDRLQKIFNTGHRIIVLVRPDLATPYLTAFTGLNATVIPYSPPRLADEQIGYYHDVLLKLVAFRLHHYIPSLKRILVLDSDQLILQPLDHVFDLPPVDVAAPRAYWGEDGTGFTSAFLLVTLSDRVWDRMAQELETIRQNVFDMDLVNAMFKQTVLMLPGDYATLNSHWETNDIPSWWMGDTPVWPYSQLPEMTVVPGQPESSEGEASEELDENELYNGQPIMQQGPQPTQPQKAPQQDQPPPPQQQASKQEQAPTQQQHAPQQQHTPPPQQASKQEQVSQQQQQQASQSPESPQQPQQPVTQQPAQPSQDHPTQPSQAAPTPPNQQQTEKTSEHQQPPSTPLGQPSQASTQTTNEMKSKPKIQRRSPATDEEAKVRAYEEDQVRKRREVYNDVLHEVYAAVKVLHFTALGKPWSWHIGDVVEAKPFAHDLFKMQFEAWQNASRRLCSPEWRWKAN